MTFVLDPFFGSQSPRVRVFSILGPPMYHGHCFLNRRMYPKMEGNIGVSFRRFSLRGKSAARMSSFLRLGMVPFQFQGVCQLF